MTIDVNGATIYCEVHGTGEPLLWVHGYTGVGSDWRFQFDRVPDGFQLIAPDLRGHGQSTFGHGEFSFRDAAADVLSVLEHLRVRRLKGIGISGGGITLLHLARARPDIVEAMVLVSVPTAYPPQARALQRQFSLAAMPEEQLQQMLLRHPGGRPQVERLVAQAQRFADDVEDVNFSAATLRDVGARALVVYGDRDPFYPVSIGVELYEALPNAALWVIPRAGHAPAFGPHADVFRREALQFLG